MEFDNDDDDNKTDKDVKLSPIRQQNSADQDEQIKGLTISMENLLGGNKKPPLGKKMIPGDDRDTMKAPEH